MMSWLQDLPTAARGLAGQPATSLLAGVTLAPGIGAALALHAMIDTVLSRALPFPEPERIVALAEHAASGREMDLAYPHYAGIAASDAFTATAHYASLPLVLTGVSLLLATTLLAACALPARRATTIAPAEALSS